MLQPLCVFFTIQSPLNKKEHFSRFKSFKKGIKLLTDNMKDVLSAIGIAKRKRKRVVNSSDRYGKKYYFHLKKK